MKRNVRVVRKMTPEERAKMKQAAAELQEMLPELRKVSQSIPSRVIQFRVSEEIHAALSQWCQEHETDLSDLIRTSILGKIGRRDLIKTMRGRGRPA